MSDLPGFRRVSTPLAMLIVADRLYDEVSSLELMLPGALERWRASGTAVEGGRSTSVRALLPSGSAVHLRPLMHGGWLRGITGPRFLGVDRPLQEMTTASGLRAKSVRVPEPLLVIALRRGPFWQIAVGSGFIEPGVSLARWLLDTSTSPSVPKMAAAAGRAVRNFHDAGGSHRDLHTGNLLVDPADFDVITIVDLDRSRLLPDVPPARRMRELMRLDRSLRKRHAPDADTFWQSLFDSYTAGDPVLKQDLLIHQPRERIRNSLHLPT